MKLLLKAYFGHTSTLCFFLLAMANLAFTLKSGILGRHLPWFFLIPLIQPFFEWFAHKYLLHAHMPEEPGWRRDFMKRLHYDHHSYPRNYELLFAPTYVVVGLMLTFFLGALLLTQSLEIALVILLGTQLAYCFYEWTHLRAHTDYNSPFPYARYMKKHHMRHHYRNENYWWGVSSHWGDVLLGTAPEQKAVSKSPTATNLSGEAGRLGIAA